MAKVQKDSCTRDSASMIRMGRSKIPHIRSACAFWGGAYGIEYDLRTANSSQNSLRSCEINSPPLSVCHLTIRLSLGRYDWLRFRNRCKASRTRAEDLPFRKLECSAFYCRLLLVLIPCLVFGLCILVPMDLVPAEDALLARKRVWVMRR